MIATGNNYGAGLLVLITLLNCHSPPRAQEKVPAAAQSAGLATTEVTELFPNEKQPPADDYSVLEIDFSLSSIDVGRENRRKLKRLAQWLTANPESAKVVLRSEADSLGDPSVNNFVKKRRAEVVENELRSFGYLNSVEAQLESERSDGRRRVQVLLKNLHNADAEKIRDILK